MRKGAIVLAVVGTLVFNALWSRPDRDDTANVDTRSHASGNPDPIIDNDNEVAESSTPAVVPWFDSWTEAAATARREGKLVFVYVALEPDACPPCARLENEVFSKPEAARLSDDAVPVRLLATGKLDAVSQAVVDRVMAVCPALFVMTHDGHVLARRESGLYAVYRRDFAVLADSPEGLDDLGAFHRMIVDARERESRERPRIDVLRGRTDADARFELATLYRERECYALAEQVLRASIVAHDDVETRALLADVLLQGRRPSDARPVLRELVMAHPDHPLHLSWRTDAVLLELACHAEPGPELRSAEGVAALALAEVAELAAHHMDFDIEARARMEMGRIHERMERQAPLARVLRWFDTNRCRTDGTRVIAASVRFEVAQLCRRAGHPEMALRQLECIQREHPESTEAQRLKHGLLDIVRYEVESSG